MNRLFIIMPGELSKQLKGMIDKACRSTEHYILITDIHNLPELRNERILFAVELNEIGINFPIFDILSMLYQRGTDSLSGAAAGIFIHSQNEYFTKSIAKDIIFIANQLGCRFPGHPLVEATGTLSNFLTWQKQFQSSLEEICHMHCTQLVERILTDKPVLIYQPKVVVLHSSSRATSNTLMLWDMIKSKLSGIQTEELHVENGTVLDCIGCSYKTCMHYSMQNSCFYGGFMVQEILPAIEKADALLWICPNYNDSVSANLMAVINRLTSLYRKIKLYDKSFFSVIVSGNSGSDSVAKQLIDALNINKGLRLPPNFAMMATANDPGCIRKIPEIDHRAQQFALNMMNEIKA